MEWSGPTCGKCGREIRGGRPWCVYCGWTPGQSEPSHLPEVQAETFRSGGTYWQFLASAVILGVPALLFGYLAVFDGREGRDLLLLVLLTVVFTFFGPVLCAVQLLRRRLLWVTIDPPRGLLLSGRTLVEWGAIKSVDRREGPFSRPPSLESVAKAIPARRLGCVAIPVLVIWLVFLPVLSVLSPWHSRVVLHLKDGTRIVYRDLENDERFTRFVSYKIT